MVLIGIKGHVYLSLVLRSGDILVAVRIPNTWAGANFYWEKVADRNVWDFSLVNVAAAMIIENNVIKDIRIVAGAVQCTPRRLSVVEQVVKGSPKNDDTASLAGQAAIRGATPLNYNHFKIPLLENLVKRAIRDA